MDLELDVNFESTDSPAVEEKDVFIKSAVETLMNIYWPAPVTDFYCRVCNYLQFDSEKTLTRHKETNDHKIRMANESISFCLICQVNTYNKELLEKHQQSQRHMKLKDIFKDAEIKAENFWNEKIAATHAQSLKEEHSFNDKKSLNEENLLTEENHLNEEEEVMEDEASLSDEKMCENYEMLKDLYKEDIVNLKENMKQFYHSKFRYTGQHENPFRHTAIRNCMKWFQPPLNSRTHCISCNSVTFRSQQERNEHVKSQSHLMHVAARKHYFCKLCNFNCLNEASYKKHKDSEKHKKLLCLLFACKTEASELYEEMKRYEKTYANIIDMVYPPNGLIEDNTYCYVCTRTINMTAVTHVKCCKPHIRNFNRYIQKLEPFVLEDGCTVCKISKNDDPDFSVMKHKNSEEHKRKQQAYVDSCGLVYPSGVLGSMPNGKGKKSNRRQAKKRKNNKSQQKNDQKKSKDGA